MALKLSDFFKIERDPCYRIGERKGIEKIAREMKLDGLSILQISKLTKLSIDQIKKL